MKRIPILDGVRGLAILLVVLFHFTGAMTGLNPFDRAALGVLHAGWIGVDLFFVLSGFLITGVLDDAKGSPAYFKNFYFRRTVRIFPPYYAFLLIMLVVLPAARGVHSSEMRHTVLHQAWLWTYLANIPGIDFGTLGHLWSLSVEEQFYLVWPLLIFFATRRTALRVCAWIAAADLVLRAIFVLWLGESARAYSLTPFRMDALAMGAWLALSVRRSGLPNLIPAARRVLATGAIIITTIALARHGFRGSDPWVQILGLTAGPASFAALLALLIHHAKHPAAKLLDNPILRAFGRYSYAIYLVHGLIILFVWKWLEAPSRTLAHWSGSETLGILPAAFAVCLGCLTAGWASWFLFERWFLKCNLVATPQSPSHARASAPCLLAKISV